MNRRLLFVISGLLLIAGGCGGGSSGSSGGGSANVATPINDRNLQGTCAFDLLTTETPGALLPDASSTVLAGVWLFDGKGSITGEAAANGPFDDGTFGPLTGTYDLERTGTGTLKLTLGGKAYELDFVANEFLDELQVSGMSGDNVVSGECSL